MPQVILETNLPGIELIARGKVRDVYAIDAKTLLIVATDRISAFDYILGSGIPDKGRVLTQLSLFWFDFLAGLTPNHLISADLRDYPIELRSFADQIEGRSMLVHRARMIDVECVARGYLCGSGWKDYQATSAVCGIPLPAGLLDGSQLPEPIFTPATKAQSGHDENISFDTAAATIGVELANELRRRTLAIYNAASSYAATKGIILADTKFEFGYVGDTLVLGDEVLTPDSSRFWPRDTWAPGGAQLSFDKQYVRNYLEGIAWNKQPPAPALPDEVALETSNKYKEAYRILTGKALS
ncbi:phosphoribosylaminoimidazolesuccinocarboxamide synthase [Bryobacter aggregatus]|uniref:phosphoribosylaminoimidazolesuccinocarboxamide synthase n=1 Tax=Bryobacter aggregatus TaxID=360054 RepID=UPI0004E1632D|nr:phosphoribosylaminoimidazolesuccinocarboxamide synthase [Bryobacter aggregatus]